MNDKFLSESHQRQLNGEDYQAAAIEIAQREGFDFDSSEYEELQSEPGPRCHCEACLENFKNCDIFNLI